MGEIADMMLDGTMDYETGEWNFGGQDGPGFPMTGAEAAAWGGVRPKRSSGIRKYIGPGEPAFKVGKRLRAKVEKFGELVRHDPYHWQVRKDGKVVADWWPHKGKFRIPNQPAQRGDDATFVKALAAAEAS